MFRFLCLHILIGIWHLSQSGYIYPDQGFSLLKIEIAVAGELGGG